MLTIFLIITLTNFQIILGTENNDTIFINSLPEQQKKEFLQRVEKRIQNEVPEVKSPESNDTNVELYEKHLEDQGKHVQNILRSEIDSFNILSRRNSNESERREEHIDLTLRTQTDESGPTRRKIEGNGIKDELNIPVVVQYDSKDVNKPNQSSRKNTTTKMQNRNTNIDKNSPKVDEITWENISLATNESSIERKRTGRRSNDFDTTLKEFDNSTAVKPENNTNSGLDSINDTATVSTTSYNVDSTETTKYPLDESSKLESVNSTSQNVNFDTLTLNLKNTQNEPNTASSTQGKVNTTNEEVTITNSTNETSSSLTPKNLRAESDDKIDTNSTNETSSSSTPINLREKSDDKIDTTTQYNENTKTNDDFGTTPSILDEKTHNTSTVIDVIVHDLDSSRTTLDTTTSKLSPDSATDPNNRNSDSVSKENSERVERQPHYVPVYNYDPENAYFNTNSQQPAGNVTGEYMANIINPKESHSKTTHIDVEQSNKNENSLRIMDVKEKNISKNNIKPNYDLYDISNGSREYSGDGAIFEKPLKHTLKKIRTKLYINKINNNSKHDENKTDINSIKAETKVKNDSSPHYTHEYDIYIHNVTELFTGFGILLKNLFNKANKNEIQSSESKRNFTKDISDVTIGIVKNITNKLAEDKNKVLSNTDTTQTTEAIRKDHNKSRIKNLKQSKEKLSSKEYQSRFHIKDRNENYKQKQDQEYEKQFEKPATKVYDEQLEMHVIIMKDLVFRNDVSLEKYDWLGTTVRIRSSLTKLQDITEKKINHIKLHYLDQKLLEFVMELYETAKTIFAKQNLELNATFRRKQRVSFRIPKKGKKVNILNRMYGELKNTKTARNRRSRQSLDDFREFLDSLEICLNDFHTAIKQVSLVTKYKKQHWFKNIKQIYITPNKDKEYLEILLHLTTTRLMSLIDEIGNKENLADDYMKNRAAIDRIEVEFTMVLRICNKLMELND